MGMTKRVLLAAAIITLFAVASPIAAAGSQRAQGGSAADATQSASHSTQSVSHIQAASTDQDDATRAARWKSLQQAIFRGRQVQDGGSVVEMDAPPRALDAAVVPVSLTFPGDRHIKTVWLIIDENPSPLAAHMTFGPKSDARSLKLRVRVDAYTNLHAVAETSDGSLYSASKFIKAAGGCSAPAGPDDAAALQDIGLMKLKLLGSFRAGLPLEAQLMIRHPNFNGMQMNQVTRYYTPARFLRTIDATYEGGSVFHLDSDISLSTDPVITFGFVPQQKGRMRIVAHDSSNATFDHSFDVPETGG
jgi:sulfur-oxidizing protein SoxY